MKKFFIFLLVFVILGGAGFGVYWFVFRNKSTPPATEAKVTVASSNDYEGPLAEILYNSDKSKFKLVIDDSVVEEDGDTESTSLDTESDKLGLDDMIYFASETGLRYDYSLRSETGVEYWYTTPKKAISLKSKCIVSGVDGNQTIAVLGRNQTIADLVSKLSNFSITNASAVTELVLPAGKTTLSAELVSFKAVKAINNNRLTTTIEESALNGFSKLTDVNTQNVTIVRKKAFYGCVALESINLSSATIIGEESFNGCSKLKEISLPSCKTIEDDAFESCSAVETIYIPVAEEIGNSAFSSCSKVKTISVPNTIKKLGNGCLNIANADITLDFEKTTYLAFANNNDGFEINDPFSETATISLKNLQVSALENDVAESDDYKIITGFVKGTFLPDKLKIKFENESRLYMKENNKIHKSVNINTTNCTITDEEGVSFKITTEDPNVLCFVDEATCSRYDFNVSYDYESTPESLTPISSENCDVLDFSSTNVVKGDAWSNLQKSTKDSLIIKGYTKLADLKKLYPVYVISSEETKAVEVKDGNKLTWNGVSYLVKVADNGDVSLVLNNVDVSEFGNGDPVSIVSGEHTFLVDDGLSTVLRTTSGLSGNSTIEDGNASITFGISVHSPKQLLHQDDVVLSVMLTDKIVTDNNRQYILINEEQYYVTSVANQMIDNLNLDYKELVKLKNGSLYGTTKLKVFVTDLNKLFGSYKNIYLDNDIKIITTNLFHYTEGEGDNTEHRTYFGDVKNIYLPTALTEIEDYAFANMSRLKGIVIDSSEKSFAVGEKVLQGCTSLDYLSVDAPKKSFTVKEYFGSETGINVNLKTVIYKNDSIADDAFKGCVYLESITMKDVTSVGKCAFEGCVNLKSLDLSNVATYGETIAKNCKKLSTITAKSNKAGEGVDILFALFGAVDSTTDENIPEIIVLNLKSFEKVDLRRAALYEKVTSITSTDGTDSTSAATFLAATNNVKQLVLEKITVDMSTIKELTQLESLTVDLLTNISKIKTIPASLKTLTTLSEYQFLDPYTSSDSYTFVDVDFSTLSSASFKNITAIHVTKNMYSADNTFIAILKCSLKGIKLSNATFPDLTLITANNVFENSVLTNISFPKLNTITVAEVFKNAQINKLDMPNLTSIGKSAFLNASILSPLSMPKLVTIEESAFQNLNSNSHFGINDNGTEGVLDLPCVTSIRTSAFSQNAYTGIIKVTFNTNETVVINFSAFENNINLKELEFTKKASIVVSAFAKCTSISSIVGKKISVLDGRANQKNLFYMFGNDSQSVPSTLSSITMDFENSEIIDNYFEGLSNVKTIAISNANKIGAKAFRACSSLETLTFDDTQIELIDNNAFEDCVSLKELKLPVVENWGYYVFNEVKCPLEVRSSSFCDLTAGDLKCGTFSGYDGSEISLPMATNISNQTFYYCVNLRTLNVPYFNISSNEYTFVTNIVNYGKEGNVDDQRLVISKDDKSCRLQYRTYVKLSFNNGLNSKTWWKFEVETNVNGEHKSTSTDNFDSGSVSTTIDLWLEEAHKDDKNTIKIKLTRKLYGSTNDSQDTMNICGGNYYYVLPKIAKADKATCTKTATFGRVYVNEGILLGVNTQSTSGKDKTE